MKITLDLECIPKKYYNGKEYYDWGKSIGMNINFTYFDNSGILSIKGYNSSKSTLIINYKNCDIKITTTRFVNKQIDFVNYFKFTNPEVLKYLVNEEDSLKYKKLSSKQIKVKCDKCNTVFNRKVSALTLRGISCKKCGDGISYPEKFMRSLLTQLKKDFVQQKKVRIDESNRFYDFALEDDKIIIEMDGEFHYTHKEYGLSIEDTQKIDESKNEWAINNGYKIIRIDSRESNLEYLKDKVLTSELSRLLDINTVDWSNIGIESETKTMIEVCKYKKENPNTFISEISKKYGIGITTTSRYLKRGTEMGLCSYIPQEERKRQYSAISKPLIVLDKNDNIVGEFNSTEECVKLSYDKFGVHFYASNVTAVLNNRAKSHKKYKFKFK
ncbi:Phage protein [Yersinia phage fHe-Yen9-03]|uniref:Phage protein n=1 Tax=Yersinia phage fHe-Yen9-03 TaxID=2052743 RepID=A0A2C9CZ15_9CAUD|nr:Phage protein [Yersinia phage fHe-Yen9-03]